MKTFVLVPLDQITEMMICCSCHSSLDSCPKTNDGKIAVLKPKNIDEKHFDGFEKLTVEELKTEVHTPGSRFHVPEETPENLKKMSDDQLKYLKYSDEDINQIRNA